MTTLKIEEYLNKNEDRNLSFRVVDIQEKLLLSYQEPHKKNHFFILLVQSGEMELMIEDKSHQLKAGKISVVFPGQVHSIKSFSNNISGTIILFEEVLFCSDILKNELSAYNVNLSHQLNCTVLANKEYKESLLTIQRVKEIYEQPSQIKKEQARFYIKTFLLELIESVHGQHPIIGKPSSNQNLYIAFKKLLNEHFKEERHVSFYAEKLFVTPKKLNAVTKQYCQETTIDAIHNRLLTEIKRQLMFLDISNKEIALDLGFNSPAAFNKFVKAKLHMTPTQLQEQLAQKYNH
ncbi:helix-turn-helix domain-containing protein [Empedobacter falsenii]|jgi:AraC family transcriptional activator of pobA|uniref:AraC family transcriptional regulator n=1 Tax=Empedobacter falsenii TaxID=343874 RepID=A0A3R8TJB8_9FLAO|nr:MULTISPECIES: helix-turn-helix transcriptional regulator [Empedobacter]MDM1063929.1 helix-turn-helix domain-containing protein [Empedobacter falsenii]MDM1139850.1 helix-turn-helix domain-containing protein [Empedobacter sp. R132-2]RRT86488.1 AraC family transcriptional regulator [Empedobacter falsenii]RRT87850.1 AraC family transcriptional regulator [Empedobacter falsenii]